MPSKSQWGSNKLTIWRRACCEENIRLLLTRMPAWGPSTSEATVVPVHFYCLSDTKTASFSSYRQNPKTVLAFSCQALWKTHYSEYTTHKVSACASLLFFLLLSSAVKTSHTTGNENSVNAGAVTGIFRPGIHLHAKWILNESLMNICLGFIHAPQSRTFLFALFSSNETRRFRKNNALEGGRPELQPEMA